MRNHRFPVKLQEALCETAFWRDSTQPNRTLTEPNPTLTQPKGGVRTQIGSVGGRGLPFNFISSSPMVPHARRQWGRRILLNSKFDPKQ